MMPNCGNAYTLGNRAARRLRQACAAAPMILAAACAAPPVKPVAAPAPSPEAVVRQQRIERAQALLAEGVKAYETGGYEEALKNLLLALDSGQLTVPEQISARKHLAFTHCVNGRELQCKEEFEKAFALDARFELLPSESGHPIWGPIYRLVKTERDLKAAGKVLAPPAKPVSPGEKMLTDAAKAYDEGDYPKALKLFQDALGQTLTAADQTRARKYSAFCLCLAGKTPQCRAEFEKLLHADPKFELDPAEAGHPSWGPSFRAAKAKFRSAPAK
jgi:tetratricopeptide (TPR) repeat protein